jgi:gas vesicle protein
MKTTNFILGVAAAALAGAAIGMLLAPEKGSDLQKRLRAECDKWIDEVKNLANNGQALAKKTAEDADEELSKIKSNLKPIQD